MKVIEQYLKRITSSKTKPQITYDDPKKFRFKPPGMDYPAKGIIKGAKAKFKHQAPGVKEDLENILTEVEHKTKE